MPTRDCRLCVYYIWEFEPSLLCALDPITAANSPEEGCRDWQEDKFLDKEGVVIKEIVVDDYYDTSTSVQRYKLIGGYAIAVSIDGWKYLTCRIPYSVCRKENQFFIEVYKDEKLSLKQGKDLELWNWGLQSVN